MKITLYFGIVLFVMCPAVLCASIADPNASASDMQDDWSDITSGDETEKLLFMEIPMVISASRQEQRLDESSIPVSVITAEDIHYSGLTNLYEVLQFVPGMDMLTVDRNRYALSVRGLHDTWSDRTLTLLNGRVADNPAFGGSEFLRLPLLLEDIKQVEVLRGPSGSAWGANAFNGAINIITKTPQECKGVFMSSGANLFKDNYHQLRWAEGNDKWAWRISGRYEDMVSSSDALDRWFISAYQDPSINIPQFPYRSQDFRRSHMFDTELYHYLTEDTTLSGGLGYSKLFSGGYDVMYDFPLVDNLHETLRSFAKLEHHFDENQKFTLQWYGNFCYNDWPQQVRYKTSENQLEAQFDLALVEDHKSTFGGSLRLTDVEQDIVRPTDMMLNEQREKRAGAFVVDRWKLTDQFSIESQFYGEYYSEVGGDWAGRVSGIYAVDQDRNHVLRLSGAKSYRTPLTALWGMSMSRWSGWLNLREGGDLSNEQIWSVEAGYLGKLHPKLTWRLDTYWQDYHDMIGFSYIGYGYQAFNQGRAEAYGAETELIFHDDWIKVSCWYAFNYFVPEGHFVAYDRYQKVRAYLPSKHKAGATVRMPLPEDFTLNLNMKHSGLCEGRYGPSWGPRPRPFDRVDLALSKKVKLGDVDGEFMIGVSDMFNETEETIADQISPLLMHDTPGRTYFASMSFQF
ncbi:MAG: TonB-dependent receptor plug domain-containing protein [Sedimentisphaerales bacterium]|nr:TonB-dependent receptor plug domain-containing protein [Sedimentisphaerales bacterium]